MRSIRVVAVLVLLGSVVAACSGGGDEPSTTSRTGPSAARGTTTTTGPGAHRFTENGARAGFALGYELVRRESPADVEADLDLMAATGAKWIRVGVSWGSIETSPGVYDWAGTDRVVHGALERGMSVLATVSSAPGWDSAPGCRTFECAPANPAPYAAFVQVAARRYGPLGVHHWEIWNEPNHVAFWAPRPDPVAYTDLLERASQAIRAVDPGSVILSGGLSPAADEGHEISPLTFLRRIYELGAGPFIDAVAHHPYQYPDLPTSPELTNAFLQTELLHEVMVGFGDGTKPIWGTEVGAPTRGRDSVSEAEQAEWLHEYYRLWNGWTFTGPLLWYTARDRGNRDDIEDSYGLVRNDRRPKPAFGTFASMVRDSPVLPRTARERR